MNEENKFITEDDTEPNKDNMQFQVKCNANWQLYTNGSIGKLKCRKCGVYVINGGTPKCLLTLDNK